MKLALLFAVVLVSLDLSMAGVADSSELVIEAYIDGPSTLHLTESGVYWTNGNSFKPGKWNHANEPTYINGVAWMPVWGNNKETGQDKSEPYVLKWGSVDVNYRLIAVAEVRGENNLDRHLPITAKRDGVEFTVLIPDPEPGPRWYTFSLSKRYALAAR
jgi:hypothetical protein